MKHLNLFLLLIILLSCQDKKKEQITQLVSEWQGKEIVFPKDIVFTRFISDTVDYKIADFPYKVLIYVDSLGCTSCKLQLNRWKELIAYTDSITKQAIPYLFFFQSKNEKEIGYLLKKDKFDLPVCIDKADKLNKINHFPNDITFQTFLLDKKNKVVVIGNPIHNPAIRDLYLKQVSGNEAPKQSLTTVQVNETEINPGNIPLGNSKEFIFTLKNTGNYPLVIIDVATTCSCASPSFDKHPAQPGEALQVKVNMTHKDKGLFNETITIKCNTNHMVKLNVRGNTQEQRETCQIN